MGLPAPFFIGDTLDVSLLSPEGELVHPADFCRTGFVSCLHVFSSPNLSLVGGAVVPDFIDADGYGKEISELIFYNLRQYYNRYAVNNLDVCDDLQYFKPYGLWVDLKQFNVADFLPRYG